ncbi:MAG: NADH-quinone oxidoreductase subunit M [Planctomycetota bacterium]
MDKWLLTAITFFPVVGMLIIPLIPKGKDLLVKQVAAAITFVPFALSCWLYYQFDRNVPGYQFEQKAVWIQMFNINYHVGVDGISLPLIFLTGLLLFVAVFSSWHIDKGVRGFFSLLLLLQVGITGVFVALDFFLFYVFWEIMLLPMYFLIGIWGGPRREYAAIKFFLYTLVGSVLMLVALIGLYLTAGKVAGHERTFSLIELARLGQAGQLQAVGSALFGMDFRYWVFLFLFIGFAIKIPVFPFHTWLPDAHVEAPTPISVILAGILLKLGGYGLMRLNMSIFPDVMWDATLRSPTAWGVGIAVLGMINVVYGAFVAMAQKDFKKLVAYSSVSHMGYVLLGLAAATSAGVNGAALQMFNHGTSSAMLFLLVGVVYDRAHHREIEGFGGLATTMPVYTGLATLGIFASLGLPGLAGFVSEAMCLIGSYQTFPVITVISTTGIIVTAAFFLWTLQRVFLGPVNEKYRTMPDVNPREVFCLVPFGVLCILLGIVPNLLLYWMGPATQDLLKIITKS